MISGFDRRVFHGHRRTLRSARDLESYLALNRILKKQFGQQVEKVSPPLKPASWEEAQRPQRPVLYWEDNDDDKEDWARSIAAHDKIREGLIGGLTAVEVCWSFKVGGPRESPKLKLKACTRKCLHLDPSWMDPEVGLMSARIPSWFPFPLQVGLNGREGLARPRDREGLQYVRQDNGCVWRQDYARAPALWDTPLRRNGAEWLNPVAPKLNPIHQQIFQGYRTGYDWSTYQSEGATDLVFGEAEFVRRHYRAGIEPSLATFGRADVMRLLGRQIPLNGKIPRRFASSLRSDVQERPAGVRIKQSLHGNSVKAYDQACNVRRVETTLHRVEGLRVYRPKEGGTAEDLDGRPLRQGVADLHRRAEVSQKANERYLHALATLDDSTRLEELGDDLSQRVCGHGKWFRGVRPWEPADSRLLAAISRGEFSLNGLRNRDLRPLLFDLPASSPKQARRQSARVSRLLRLLRAQGLVQKVPRTHRYQVTAPGRRALTANLAARHATIAQLAKVA